VKGESVDYSALFFVFNATFARSCFGMTLNIFRSWRHFIQLMIIILIQMKLTSSCHLGIRAIYNVSTKDRFFTSLRFELN